MTDIEMMEVLATVVNQIQQEAAGRRIHCVHTDDALWIFFGEKGCYFFSPRLTKYIAGGCILYIVYTLMMHCFFWRV